TCMGSVRRELARESGRPVSKAQRTPFNDPPGSRNRRKLDTPGGGFDSEQPTLNKTALGASAHSPRVGLSSQFVRNIEC
ncbi:MAG TPA: hypothetical protein VIH54_03200, partial [Chthoniobacterales bacterium]